MNPPPIIRTFSIFLTAWLTLNLLLWLSLSVVISKVAFVLSRPLTRLAEKRRIGSIFLRNVFAKTVTVKLKLKKEIKFRLQICAPQGRKEQNIEKTTFCTAKRQNSTRAPVVRSCCYFCNNTR